MTAFAVTRIRRARVAKLLLRGLKPRQIHAALVEAGLTLPRHAIYNDCRRIKAALAQWKGPAVRATRPAWLRPERYE